LITNSNRAQQMISRLDSALISYSSGDAQSTIDDLRFIAARTDGVAPPPSAKDWITNSADADLVYIPKNMLINELFASCGSCT